MNSNYDRALEKFRNVLAQAEAHQEIQEIIESCDAVLGRYKPIFRLSNLPYLTEEDFRSFLYFENNRHWSGLYRHVTSLTADMNVLRDTLISLIDPSLPLAKRFDQAIGRINGFGKGLATAILLVSSPEEYGVWNNTSEAALRKTDIWREFVRGRTMGQRYEKLNGLLISLAKDLGIDLWTLDALMWGIVSEEKNEANKPSESVQTVRKVYSFFDDVQHPVLKDRLSKLANAPLDTIIREAGVIFETSLRLAGNLDSGSYGVKLVDELLEPGGKLVFSSHGGEQQGVQYLFRGAMQFIRNPPMHKIIDYPESVAKQYIRLIDSLLLLLGQATRAEELSRRKRLPTLMPTNRDEFLSKCKPEISPFFTRILDAADQRGHTIYWGTKGFSIRVYLSETDSVASIAYGFPPNLFQIYFGHLPISGEQMLMLRKEILAYGIFKEAPKTLSVYLAIGNLKQAEDAYELMLQRVEGIA